MWDDVLWKVWVWKFYLLFVCLFSDIGQIKYHWDCYLDCSIDAFLIEKGYKLLKNNNWCDLLFDRWIVN